VHSARKETFSASDVELMVFGSRSKGNRNSGIFFSFPSSIVHPTKFGTIGERRPVAYRLSKKKNPVQ